MKRAVLLAAIATLIFASAKLPADDEKNQHAFFENEIRPVLNKNCYSCHGPRKQKSGLRLDSRNAMIEGGDSGGVLEPKHPDDSLLLDVLIREEDQMPPGKRLTDREIAAIRKWIQMGAPWPKNNPPRTGVRFTDEDRQYWAFQPLSVASPKRSPEDSWSTNEIDFRIWEIFKKEGHKPAPLATKQGLLRRVFYDLIGLPPSVEEQRQFLNDRSAKAYENLVDRLLADDRYGEKWARHWLDLVRYAESDGYKQDDYRPNAWRYRDYVIRSFNEDKPYDQFVLEQLAGDELDPSNPEYRIATGFLRHWIYEYNQRDVRTQWDTILNDVTNVAGDVFLGLSMNCARCHDHKFDPISQADYFRLKAVFAPLYPRDDIPLASPRQLEEYEKANAQWLTATAEIRAEIEKLESKFHRGKIEPAIDKFPLDIRPMMRKPEGARSPYEQQLSSMAFRQVSKLNSKELESKMKGKEKERWQQLVNELKKYDSLKPAKLPVAMTVNDVGTSSPPTFLPDDRNQKPIEPGVLSILRSAPLDIHAPAGIPSTGRRTALARWLVSDENPLTARVIANRIWHYHFGEGIVKSTSDFGRLGRPPADALFLDFLAKKLIAGGWQLKKLHRDILLSSTYRQSVSSSVRPNLRPFQQVVRRIDAEQIRDSMLSVTGELDNKQGGPAADTNSKRRTVYTKVIRNRRDPLLDAFDAPDNFNSTSVRNVTTTPTQSLLMINGKWTLERARAMAKKLLETESSQEKKARTAGSLIDRLFSEVYCRHPDDSERTAALEFLGMKAEQLGIPLQPLTDLCHAMLNSNEFLYLD